ncbi:hypothetical protein [Streptomyces sp. XD-27]|uniref:hypothetical protein n=1 Tax=Streptomyces sp. XD-27 TaxID=3062779 RepID=UPI0026F47663|nr:hypothetical protein [Streptomyces sp. XD-27]WKX71391.1 hypothetical protein Q3Y56_17080 [Streptomyces sp. XD-27]
MEETIARIVEWLLRLLLPAPGRHRAAHPSSTTSLQGAPTVNLPPAPAATAPAVHAEDVALVRPYLVAHERCQEARRQPHRRRTLWLAVHGVDVGTRWIHGVRVAAR